MAATCIPSFTSYFILNSFPSSTPNSECRGVIIFILYMKCLLLVRWRKVGFALFALPLESSSTYLSSCIYSCLIISPIYNGDRILGQPLTCNSPNPWAPSLPHWHCSAPLVAVRIKPSGTWECFGRGDARYARGYRILFWEHSQLSSVTHWNPLMFLHCWEAAVKFISASPFSICQSEDKRMDYKSVEAGGYHLMCL